MVPAHKKRVYSTIRLFWNMPLQFDVGLNRVILYVFDSLGPTGALRISYAPKWSYYLSLLSTHWRVGPMSSSSSLHSLSGIPSSVRHGHELAGDVDGLFRLLSASAMAINPSHPSHRHHAHPPSCPQSRPSSAAMATDLTSAAGGRGRMGRGRRIQIDEL
jgi:hypothetical protein